MIPVKLILKSANLPIDAVIFNAKKKFSLFAISRRVVLSGVEGLVESPTLSS